MNIKQWVSRIDTTVDKIFSDIAIHPFRVENKIVLVERWDQLNRLKKQQKKTDWPPRAKIILPIANNIRWK